MPTRNYGVLIWAAVLWILIQLPYLTGPFRIDDPYHLEAAKQMRRAPGDPYGFQINWDGTPKPAFETYASPPLVPGWLALWSSVFPQGEVSLHFAMLPFSLVAMVAFGIFARSFDLRPSIAMALLACSPAFFLTSQVLMPDMPMLCLFLLAVTGARLYQTDRCRPAAVAAFLAGFGCPLAKYNGAMLVPVLICLALAGPCKGVGDNSPTHDRPPGLRSLWARRGGCGGFTPGMIAILSAPILALVSWGAFTWAKYGAVHFLSMSDFQRGQAHSLDPAMMTAGVLGALGLGVVPLGVLGFLIKLQNPSQWLRGLALCGGVAGAWLAVFKGYGLSSVLLFGFSVSVAGFILGLVVRYGWRNARTSDWALMPLVVWILGGFAFQYGLMFSAVRYVLFLAPPVILLALRLSSWAPRPHRLTAILGANLLVTAAIGAADARQASVYPAVVSQAILPLLKKTSGRFFFDGHWGFQYYASQIGGTPFDELRPPLFRAGDLVVVAQMAWPKLTHPPQASGLDIETTTFTVPSSGSLRTLSCSAGANFYASSISDCARPTWLPFGLSSDVEERFVFYSITRPSAGKRSD